MKKILFIIFIVFLGFSKAQSDCISAIPVCGNAGFTYLPSGTGTVPEGNEPNDCLSGENNSVWYSFTIATGGTLTFLITPAGDIDYDWALYGPNVACSNLAAAPPIRCSYAGVGSGYLTGLNMTATDTSEGAGGDGFVRYIDVLPGETYYLLVDNFSTTVVSFSLTWGGTATLASAFNDPALQPYPFVEPGTNQDGEVIICEDPQIFDFTTLDSGILNGNSNFEVNYYLNSNDAIAGTNEITTPIVVDTNTTYYYTINYNDPANPTNPINACKNIDTITFVQGTITADDDTLIECSNNNSGVAEFDLTSANVFNDPNATVQYYPSMADLNAGSNEITNPTNYISAQGDVFALVTTQFGCTATAKITLQFFTLIEKMDDALVACYILENPTNGLFDLTSTNVSTTGGVTLEYYPSQTDAENQTNIIGNPDAYISPDSVVYVRITDQNGCWKVAKITLTVTPPKYSPVLKDTTICVEDFGTLDAGPGYDDYLWSNGETTQVITNLPIGEYWVDLTFNECVTRQYATVYPSPNPVIKFIDVTNNTVTVTVEGGQPPYQYSMDGINWQDSNIFTNVPRGASAVFVKDSFDCIPVSAPVLIPNLVNAITPNGDHINDYIDYSELAFTKDFKIGIYDRYGVQIAEANKTNGYKWDGTIGGKKEKVPTGTYWYTITWTNDGTGLKFTNWILVKNNE